MKKVTAHSNFLLFVFFLTFILLYFFSQIKPTPAWADTCEYLLDRTNAPINEKIVVLITARAGSEGFNVILRNDKASPPKDLLGPVDPRERGPNDTSSYSYEIDLSKVDQGKLTDPTSKLVIHVFGLGDKGGECKDAGSKDGNKGTQIVVNVPPVPPSPGSCVISTDPAANVEVGTTINFDASGISPADGLYVFKIIKDATVVDKDEGNTQVQVTGGVMQTQFYTPNEGGIYAASLTSIITGLPVCASENILVEDSGDSGGGGANDDFELPPPLPPCANFDANQKCTSVNTALGEIGTSPEGFIKSIFGIVLGLSGGLALLLIIYSGYQLISSQGKPETLEAAREQLTAAIIGLLFIIFSLVLLQFIGFNILRIPGIGP